MRSRIALVAGVAVVAAAVVVGARTGGGPAFGGSRLTSARHSLPLAVSAVPVVTGLNYPAAFTFAPDGRIFFGERLTGKIRIYDPSNGSNTPFFTITHVSTTGEQGLLGLAIHPRYPSRPLVYAYATRNINGSLKDQIISVQDSGGTGSRPRLIWSSDTTAGDYHDGGRILFGPDRRLYAIQGDAHKESNAQDLTNDAGKILRMTDTGAVPPDNPFPGSRIWAYGIRNSFGFNFDPLTRNLWETENGPTCNDELNFISKGANYGWGPSETCNEPPPPPQNTNQDGPSPVLPQVWYTPTIAPVGMAFCVGCGITQSEGTFFFGAYNTSDIWQVSLSGDRKTITSDVIVYSASEAPLSIERGPDSAVYFSDFEGIWKLVQG